MAAVPEIKALDVTVVNRIAAGEVIQRPASALKELLENSLDAGASHIQVTVKEGGLKMLQIQDDGHGVREQDLPILCKRHTTSKLREYEDLHTISTLGFRGEALASISFVSHTTITTRTADAPHALLQTYKDGEPTLSAPRPCAGAQGTTVLVEDMFYNVPARKRAMSSASEELSRIVQVLQWYAVYKAGVSITCRRVGEARPELHTMAGATRLDVIRSIYSSAVAKEVVPLCVSCGPELAKVTTVDAPVSFRAEGYVSTASHQGKKTICVLFINSRAVECSPLRKTLEATYTALLPKATRPFLFLEITMPPQHVDVNVHPTKSSVAFLHQSELIEEVRQGVEAMLLRTNSTRSFNKQAALTGGTVPVLDGPTRGGGGPVGGANPSLTQKAPYRPERLVRTDYKAQSLGAFGFTSQPRTDADASASSAALAAAANAPKRRKGKRAPEGAQQGDPPPVNAASAVTQKPNPAPSSLHSVRQLLEEATADGSPGLLRLIREHTYVGWADEAHALLQHGTKLYLADIPALTRLMFKQQALARHGSLGRIRLEPPAPIRELMRAALRLEAAAGRYEPEPGSDGEICELMAALLSQNAAMLSEYYSLDVTPEGGIASLPLLVEGYCPDLAALPGFLFRLCNEVDWDNEAPCFRGISRALAELYAWQLGGVGPEGCGGGDDTARSQREWVLQHVVCGALRNFLRPTKELADSLVEVADLQKMYRIFERC